MIVNTSNIRTDKFTNKIYNIKLLSIRILIIIKI